MLRYDPAVLPGGSRPFAVGPSDYAASGTPAGFALRDECYAVALLPFDGRWGFVAVAAGAGRVRVDERELDPLDGIANQAKLAIANALSYRTLEKTFLSTVEALANALEASDEETSSHTRWITDLALRAGRELGLDAAAPKRVRARCALPRHRQDRDPGVDPRQARAADPRGAPPDRDAPRAG